MSYLKTAIAVFIFLLCTLLGVVKVVWMSLTMKPSDYAKTHRKTENLVAFGTCCLWWGLIWHFIVHGANRFKQPKHGNRRRTVSHLPDLEERFALPIHVVTVDRGLGDRILLTVRSCWDENHTIGIAVVPFHLP